MTASREFQDQLTDFLPKMRIWAMAQRATAQPQKISCRKLQ